MRKVYHLFLQGCVSLRRSLRLLLSGVFLQLGLRFQAQSAELGLEGLYRVRLV